VNDRAPIPFDPELPGLTDVGPRALEVGSIRIGYKDDRGIPTKLDFFVICSKHKEEIGKDRRDRTIERPVIRRDIMEAIYQRQSVQKVPDNHRIAALRGLPMITELDVMLTADIPELAFYTYRGAYSRTRVLCRGFGVGTDADRWSDDQEEYVSIKCPGNSCDWAKSEGRRGQPPPCRPHGVLRVVLLDDPMLGGYYLYRTTSAQTIGAINMGLRATAGMTGGRMAGLPFRLRVVPAQSKDDQGRTRKYSLVTCGYAGNPRLLLEEASNLADQRMRLGIKSEVEHQKLLSEIHRPVAEIGKEEVQDVATEFFPEPENGTPALPPAQQVTAPPPVGQQAAMPVEPADSVEAAAPPPDDEDIPPPGDEYLPPAAEEPPPRDPQTAAPEDEVRKQELLAKLSGYLSKKLGGDVKELKRILESLQEEWIQPTKAPIEVLERYVAHCINYFEDSIPF
jgi:hypothetical protein